MTAYVLTRDVTVAECGWIDRDHREGEIVYASPDGGRRGPAGTVACRTHHSVEEWIHLPNDALTEYERSWEQTCYMPHDPRA